jgi:hypothetical protein
MTYALAMIGPQRTGDDLRSGDDRPCGGHAMTHDLAMIGPEENTP